jgi:putative sterol carrier protein
LDVIHNKTTLTTTATTTDKMSNTSNELSLETLFETIKNNIESMADDEDLPPYKFVYVLSDNKKYLMDLKERTLSELEEDSKEEGDVTISMSDEDLLLLMTGEANPELLFFTGRLSVSGSLTLAMSMIGLREKLVRGPSNVPDL